MTATKTGPKRERGYGGNAHQHLRRYPHAGHDHRPGQWQLKAHQGGESAHSHASRRLDERLVDAGEADDDAAQYWKESEEHQHDDGRQHTDADDSDQHSE